MRMELHGRITEFVARSLGLPDDLVREMVDACLEPDRSRRYREVKHHEVPRELMVKYVVEARKRYLRGDAVEAARLCGMLLHYVQDSLVPPPRGRRGKALHISVETRSASFDPSTVPREWLKPARGLRGVKYVIRALHPLNDPMLAAQRATLYSYAIAAAVFDTIDAPPEMDACASLAKEYLSMKGRREAIVLPLVISLLPLALFANKFISNSTLFLYVLFVIGFALFVAMRLAIALYTRKCEVFVKNIVHSRILTASLLPMIGVLYLALGLMILVSVALVLTSLITLLRAPGVSILEENSWWYRYECRAPPHLCTY